MDESLLSHVRSWLQARFLERFEPVSFIAAFSADGSNRSSGLSASHAIVTLREFHEFLLAQDAPLTRTVSHCCQQGWIVQTERRGPFGTKRYYWITGLVQSENDADNQNNRRCETEEYRTPDAEEDPYDDRYAWMMGKRLFLGVDTQISRMFWLLVSPLGRIRTMQEVQVAVDGLVIREAEESDDNVRRAHVRVRKAISKLRERLREAGLDHHVVINRSGTQKDPEYAMIRRFPNRK